MALRATLSRGDKRRVGVRSGALGLALAAAAACTPQGAELLDVTAVVPAEAQFGDSLQIVGDGFGLGNPATVTFRGRVYRAGRAPEPLRVSFRARTESQRELVLTLGRDAERVFCGDADEAAHATFRGDVEVAIAARSPGAPPATGRLSGVVLELYPAVQTRGGGDRLLARGGDALAFFGIDVASAPDGSLTVLEVADASRAAAAELLPGDRLVRAGGVTVLSPSDLVPPPARELSLQVLRGDSERSLRLDADGFSARPPSELDWAALPVAAAALGFGAAATPLSRLLGWAAHGWLEQERTRGRRALTGPARPLERASWLDRVGGVSGLLVWLAVAGALAAPIVRRAPVDVSAGLLVAMFVSSAALAASAIVEGGGAGSGWSIRRALGAAWQRCLTAAPAWLAVLALGFENGVDLHGAARAGGPWPWAWNAFANPGLGLACLVVLATTVPRAEPPARRLMHARLARGAREEGWFERAYVCSACAVVSALFLGGDALPGVDPGRAPAWLTAVGYAWLLAKYTLLVLGVSTLRGARAGITLAEWSAVSLRLGLPAALLALTLTPLWRLFAATPLGSWVALGFGPASLAVAIGALALGHARAGRAARAPAPPSLSPWL